MKLGINLGGRKKSIPLNNHTKGAERNMGHRVPALDLENQREVVLDAEAKLCGGIDAIIPGDSEIPWYKDIQFPCWVMSGRGTLVGEAKFILVSTPAL